MNTDVGTLEIILSKLQVAFWLNFNARVSIQPLLLSLIVDPIINVCFLRWIQLLRVTQSERLGEFSFCLANAYTVFLNLVRDMSCKLKNQQPLMRPAEDILLLSNVDKNGWINGDRFLAYIPLTQKFKIQDVTNSTRSKAWARIGVYTTDATENFSDKLKTNGYMFFMFKTMVYCKRQ